MEISIIVGLGAFCVLAACTITAMQNKLMKLTSDVLSLSVWRRWCSAQIGAHGGRIKELEEIVTCSPARPIQEEPETDQHQQDDCEQELKSQPDTARTYPLVIFKPKMRLRDDDMRHLCNGIASGLKEGCLVIASDAIEIIAFDSEGKCAYPIPAPHNQ